MSLLFRLLRIFSADTHDGVVSRACWRASPASISRYLYLLPLMTHWGICLVRWLASCGNLPQTRVSLVLAVRWRCRIFSSAKIQVDDELELTIPDLRSDDRASIEAHTNEPDHAVFGFKSYTPLSGENHHLTSPLSICSMLIRPPCLSTDHGG